MAPGSDPSPASTPSSPSERPETPSSPFAFGAGASNWDEALSLVRSERACPPAFAGARCSRLEFSARGDRTNGRLLTPADPGPHPVVLLQHGAGGSCEAEYLDCAARWVASGVAVLSLDLPLHGERASAKMSRRLAEAIASATRGEELDDTAHALWTEFARQVVADLRRAVDALETLEDIDAQRLAFAGFSLGAITGAAFCAVDPRPRAAVLALAGGGFGPSAVDPARWIDRIAPRPVLLIGTEADETIPRTATETLFAAASEPKRLEWFPGSHGTLPGRALACMFDTLQKAIR